MGQYKWVLSDNDQQEPRQASTQDDKGTISEIAQRSKSRHKDFVHVAGSRVVYGRLHAHVDVGTMCQRIVQRSDVSMGISVCLRG